MCNRAFAYDTKFDIDPFCVVDNLQIVKFIGYVTRVVNLQKNLGAGVLPGFVCGGSNLQCYTFMMYSFCIQLITETVQKTLFRRTPASSP